MEIIAEIEGERRGVYGGGVGYFSRTGNLDMAIAIRTLILKDGTAFAQAGAGIVADSDPAFEFDETQRKAAALWRAVAMAETTGTRSNTKATKGSRKTRKKKMGKASFVFSSLSCSSWIFRGLRVRSLSHLPMGCRGDPCDRPGGGAASADRRGAPDMRGRCRPTRAADSR
jgi:hypothetical protein